MQLTLRVRWPLALFLGLAMAAVTGGARAQEAKKDKDKADNSRKVSFDSYDGVAISGTYYPKLAGGKDKDACVLLLHNFDHQKGGNSHQDGWDHLAEGLQKDGYAVLSFDFRGFGDSKQVGRSFWDRTKAPENQNLPGAARLSESIDQKSFPRQYYAMLVNDIAAARAFLDRRNDKGEVNSSNLIVIGAGEGATLGALWLAAECKRKRSRGMLPDPMTGGLRPDLDEPESRDVASAIWLSVSPTLGGLQMPVRSCLVESGGEHKIPMAFIYGNEDADGKRYTLGLKASVMNHPNIVKMANTKLTGEKGIDTKLKGSQLLGKSLDTEEWIIKQYLAKVMEVRGSKEAKRRDPEKTVYYWSSKSVPRPMPAKLEKEDMPRLIPRAIMNLQVP